MQENPREYVRKECYFNFKAFLRKVAQVHSRNLEELMSGREEDEKSTATIVWSQQSTTCAAYRTKPGQKVRHCEGLRL
jgi:predicted secreted protein